MKTPAQDIILAPVITEASMAGIALKKYTFKVATLSLIHICAPDERQFRPMERDLKKMDAAGMLMIFSVFPTARYVLGPYAL